MKFNAVVDYTRRCDPACGEGLKRLEEKLSKHGAPTVFHFWTKAPAKVAELFAEPIQYMKENGSLVVAQVTLNYYGEPLEHIPAERMELKPLADMLGGDHIRLRFDPIVLGSFSMEQYLKCVKSAVDNGVKRITVNFLVPEYEKVDQILKRFGVTYRSGSEDEKRQVLRDLRKVTPSNIEIAVCAETANMLEEGISKAGCADPDWFASLGADMSTLTGHTSRKGCGCFYTHDWGEYPSRGGYVCPHKCLYCYAKHNIKAWEGVI